MLSTTASNFPAKIQTRLALFEARFISKLVHLTADGEQVMVAVPRGTFRDKFRCESCSSGESKQISN
jgi:hypothetical protein